MILTQFITNSAKTWYSNELYILAVLMLFNNRAFTINLYYVQSWHELRKTRPWTGRFWIWNLNLNNGFILTLG